MNEPFDKKVLFATVLLIAWLFVYFTFLAPKTEKPKAPPDQATQQQPAQPQGTTPPPSGEPGTAAPPAVAAVPVAPAAAPQVPPAGEFVDTPEEEIRFETPTISAVLTSRGGQIKSWKLRKYLQTIKPDSPPVELVPDILATSPNIGGTVLPDDPSLRADLPMRVAEKSSDRVVFTGTTPSGLTLRKSWAIAPDGYTARLRVELTNGTAKALRARLATDLVEKAVAPASPTSVLPSCGGGAQMLAQRNEVGYVRQSLQKDQVQKAKPREDAGGVFWTGYDSVYFLTAIASTDPEKTGRVVRMEEADHLVRTRMFYEAADVAPGATAARDFLFYLGPKTKDTLQAAGFDLDRSLDYGWFGPIAAVFVTVLKFFEKYVHNWGAAIILLTVAVKLLLYPLTLKSFKSMGDMQRIQPLMQHLREQYKDDRTKLNEATMRLYKEHGINPAGGCLPMLLQLPVFVALYRVIYQSIELRHAGFIFWIQDLAAPDPYYVTPIIMGATQYLSQRLTPTTGDPAQAKMMQLMPVFFTFLFLNFPSGLVLYWLVNNVLTIAQQQWIRHQNPVVPIEPPKAPMPAPETGVRRKKGKKGA